MTRSQSPITRATISMRPRSYPPLSSVPSNQSSTFARARRRTRGCERVERKRRTKPALIVYQRDFQSPCFDVPRNFLPFRDLSPILSSWGLFALPLSDEPHDAIEISLCDRAPIGRGLRREFLQRLAKSRHSALQRRYPALAFAKRLERSAEIVLRRSPLEGNAFAREFLQRLAKSRHSALQRRYPALAFAKRLERSAEIVLRRSPLEGNAFAREFL